MKNVYRVLAYLLAVEVVVQAMAIAYAVARLGTWVEDDRGVLDKRVIDPPDFPGGGGLEVHGVNGAMVIPVLALLLLVVSFFAEVPGGVRRAVVLLGMIVLQVLLGFLSSGVPFVVVLHVLVAFGIVAMALEAGRSASGVSETAEQPSGGPTA